MSRTRSRTDDNQLLIVQSLRQHGASVQPLHTVGKGCPDLLVGFKGANYLLEIKDGLKSPSKRKLTLDQSAWHEVWAGSVTIVTNVAEAIALLEDRPCAGTPV
jgi:hypothetical protein